MDYLNIDTSPIFSPSNPSRITDRQYDVDLYGRHENPSTIRRASRPSASIGPFQIILGTSANTIQVAPGTINGFLPSSILTDLIVLASGTSYIYARVNASSSLISSIQMISSATAPSGYGSGLGSPPITFDVFIGAVVDSTLIYQAVNQNLSAFVNEQFTTDEGTWFIWSVQ